MASCNIIKHPEEQTRVWVVRHFACPNKIGFGHWVSGTALLLFAISPMTGRFPCHCQKVWSPTKKQFGTVQCRSQTKEEDIFDRCDWIKLRHVRIILVCVGGRDNETSEAAGHPGGFFLSKEQDEGSKQTEKSENTREDRQLLGKWDQRGLSCLLPHHFFARHSLRFHLAVVPCLFETFALSEVQATENEPPQNELPPLTGRHQKRTKRAELHFGRSPSFSLFLSLTPSISHHQNSSSSAHSIHSTRSVPLFFLLGLLALPLQTSFLFFVLLGHKRPHCHFSYFTKADSFLDCTQTTHTST